MKKILIGGSPCTYWSISQKPDTRETVAEGLGWELFKNYLIALEKFKPDYFLYENNESISKEIQKEIEKSLGVELLHLDSALVSAQKRQRIYGTNITGVEVPEDRGLKVKDILVPGFKCENLIDEAKLGLLIQLVVYGVSIGAIYGTIKTRLNYIEAKLDKHNNVVERVYKLEQDQAVIMEKQSVANHRIHDLEEETK